jgi:molybdopterin molybdotransferase
MAELKPGRLSIENVPLHLAFGRVLAEKAIANERIPPTNTSAMEGYAIRFQDVKSATPANPRRLRVIGHIGVDEKTKRIYIREGEAVSVATGATIPRGADTIVRIEHVRRFDGEIAVYRQIERGKDVSYAGADIPRGLVFRKGHLLRPQDVEVLTALRLQRVKVFSKPQVAIISVGDELCEVEDLDPSKQVITHALNISGLVKGLGAEPKIYGVVRDDVKAIRRFVKRALNETDIILTIAGSSIGEGDLVSQAVSSFPSAKTIAHGIAMKPGKPTLVAVVNGKPLIGLPGHVASTNAAFYVFATKLIEKYSGASNLTLPVAIAELAEEFKCGTPYSFVRFRIQEQQNRLVATPLNGEFILMSDFVRSNGFAILPPRTEIAKGEMLRIMLYSIHEFHHIMHHS